MTIRFKCTRCGTELNVADGLAGKQGKCPKCKSILTVPAPKAAPVARKKVEEEVAAAEVVEEEDVVEAVVEDVDEEVEEVEERRPKKGKPVSRRRDEDEDDRPRRKKKRRDEDEEEDEEEDDRPRKKKRRDDDEEEDRPRKKKRRYDDDEDEDDEDDEDDRPRQSPRQRRAALNRAALGVSLTSISSFLYVGALVLCLLCFIIMATASGGAGGGGKTLFDILKIIGWIIMLGYVAAAVLAVVGSSLTITTPARKGALGLSIATVCTSGLSLALFIWFMIKILNLPFVGSFMGFMMGMSSLNPFAGIDSKGSGGLAPIGGGDFGAILYLLPLAELGRLTCFALYLWACGKSFRDRDMAKSAFVLGIVTPSTCAGMGLIMWILQSAIKTPSKGVAIMLVIFYLLVYIGVMGYYAFVTLTSKGTIEGAD